MMEHSFLFLEIATSSTGSSAKVHDNFKSYTILVLFASDLLMCLTAIKSLEATGWRHAQCHRAAEQGTDRGKDRRGCVTAVYMGVHR